MDTLVLRHDNGGLHKGVNLAVVSKRASLLESELERSTRSYNPAVKGLAIIAGSRMVNLRRILPDDGGAHGDFQRLGAEREGSIDRGDRDRFAQVVRVWCSSCRACSSWAHRHKYYSKDDEQ